MGVTGELDPYQHVKGLKHPHCGEKFVYSLGGFLFVPFYLPDIWWKSLACPLLPISSSLHQEPSREQPNKGHAHLRFVLLDISYITSYLLIKVSRIGILLFICKVQLILQN